MRVWALRHLQSPSESNHYIFVYRTGQGQPIGVCCLKIKTILNKTTKPHTPNHPLQSSITISRSQAPIHSTIQAKTHNLFNYKSELALHPPKTKERKIPSYSHLIFLPFLFWIKQKLQSMKMKKKNSAILFYIFYIKKDIEYVYMFCIFMNKKKFV